MTNYRQIYRLGQSDKREGSDDSETITCVVSNRPFYFPDFTLSAKIPTESSKSRLSFFSRFSTFCKRY